VPALAHSWGGGSHLRDSLALAKKQSDHSKQWSSCIIFSVKFATIMTLHNKSHKKLSWPCDTTNTTSVGLLNWAGRRFRHISLLILLISQHPASSLDTLLDTLWLDTGHILWLFSFHSLIICMEYANIYTRWIYKDCTDWWIAEWEQH